MLDHPWFQTIFASSRTPLEECRMIRLGAVAVGRDNNFNLIRVTAAAAVLVSHAWPIALGPDALQPLQRMIGHTLGELAVFVFFAVSGFFISASFARSAGVIDFIRARVLRLFPCLAVALVLAAFVMGPAVTRMPLAFAVASWHLIEAPALAMRHRGRRILAS